MAVRPQNRVASCIFAKGLSCGSGKAEASGKLPVAAPKQTVGGHYPVAACGRDLTVVLPIVTADTPRCCKPFVLLYDSFFG